MVYGKSWGTHKYVQDWEKKKKRNEKFYACIDWEKNKKRNEKFYAFMSHVFLKELKEKKIQFYENAQSYSCIHVYVYLIHAYVILV